MQELIRIIIRYLDKSINKTETNKLNKWLKESKENEVLFYRINSEKIRNKEIEKMFSYDKELAWENINNKLLSKRHKLIFSFFKVAAILFVLIGGYFLVLETNNKQLQNKKEVISVGRSMAKFITSSGKTYHLDSTKLVVLKNNNTITNGGKLISVNSDINKGSNQIIYNTIEVPLGGEYNIQLIDGTKVYLNSQSSLKIPNKFKGQNRKVFLSGEAYFEVTKNTKPFIVNVGDSYVKVLGTSFNVNAYKDNNSIRTTLVTGIVNVGNNINKNEIKIYPGYQAIYNRKTKIIKSKKVNIEYYIGWKNGVFAFKKERFENVMKILSRWYEFKVIYESPEIKDYIFTGKMKRYESIEDILKNFEKTDDISYSIEQKTIKIMKNKN